MEEQEDGGDEELLDVEEMLERQKKARALERRKAALVLQQQMRADEKLALKLKNKLDGGKGKAKAQQDATLRDDDVVSSDSDELEICIPRPASPKIEAKPHDLLSHTQKKLKDLVPKREQSAAAHEEMTESQFHRAGRTFGRGAAKMVVDPHVASKMNGSKAGQGKFAKTKTNGRVSKKAQDKLLLGKASRQAREDTLRRVEDWQRRGGTLRVGSGSALEMQSREVAGEVTQGREDRAKGLMDSMRMDAERAGRESELENEDGDDADDEDFVGSDGEAEDDDEEREVDSNDELGSVDEMDLDEESDSAAELEDQDDAVKKGEDAESSSLRLGASADSSTQRSQYPIEQDENLFRRAAGANKATRAAITDDEDEGNTPAPKAVAATQYHSFIVTEQAPFPHFDPTKMAEVSLTQAFGNPEDSQAMPQASRAVFEEGAGFSQMFSDDGLVDAELQPTPTQVLPKTLPRVRQSATLNAEILRTFSVSVFLQMFRKGGDLSDSPVLGRHIIGEAPMILDAALRDADIRDEAERAFYDIQQRKAQAQADREAYVTSKSLPTPAI